MNKYILLFMLTFIVSVNGLTQSGNQGAKHYLGFQLNPQGQYTKNGNNLSLPTKLRIVPNYTVQFPKFWLTVGTNLQRFSLLGSARYFLINPDSSRLSYGVMNVSEFVITEKVFASTLAVFGSLGKKGVAQLYLGTKFEQEEKPKVVVGVIINFREQI